MYINKELLKVKRYSSSELKLVKSELDKHIKDNKVEILFCNNESYFELLLIINYYLKKNVIVDLILTYLPYQRMDHKDRDELDTISYIKDIFNNLGINKLTICEPHCKIDEFNNVNEISFIEKLKDKVFKEINFDEEKDFVVLTDKGGLSRYKQYFKNLVYFNKVRDIDSGLIIKHEIVGEIDIKRKFIIVDDIISTGDTIINIVDYLTSEGVKDIYILSGHFEKNRYNRRLLINKNVKKIFSTNSLQKKQYKKLKLYDVKEIIYE